MDVFCHLKQLKKAIWKARCGSEGWVRAISDAGGEKAGLDSAAELGYSISAGKKTDPNSDI